MSGTFEDLKAWRLAMDLVVTVYTQTQVWPKDERYGLTTQLRRAACRFLATSLKVRGELQTAISPSFSTMRAARFMKFKLNSRSPVGSATCQRTANAMDHQAAEVGRVLNGLIREIQGMTRREGEPDDALCPETRKPEAQRLKPRA